MPCRGLVNEGEPCPNTIAPVRVELKRSGHWSYDALCADCQARADMAEAKREYRNAQIRARVPPRFRDLRLDDPNEGSTVWLPDDAEMVEAFQARREQEGRLVVCSQNLHVVRLMRRWDGASFVLHGPVGTGKTAMLAAFVNRQLWAKTACLWVTEADLLASQRRPVAGQPNRDERVLEDACRVPVLALDELGAGVNPEGRRQWERESSAAHLVERVVCTRYDKNLPVFITTNLAPKQLAKLFGQRTTSRLREMTGDAFLEITGYSWRTGLPLAQQSVPEISAAHNAVRDGRALAAGHEHDEDSR